MFTPDLKWDSYISRKIFGKCLSAYNDPKRTWRPLCSNFIWFWSEQKWCIAAISFLKLSNSFFSFLKKVQKPSIYKHDVDTSIKRPTTKEKKPYSYYGYHNRHIIRCVTEYFPLYNLFSTDEKSKADLSPIVVFYGIYSDQLHSLVSRFQSLHIPRLLLSSLLSCSTGKKGFIFR